jgi:hypothetical protein
MEVIISLIENQPWFVIVSAVVTLASAIAAATPTPQAGTVLAKIYSVIDLLALNIGKAKQK